MVPTTSVMIAVASPCFSPRHRNAVYPMTGTATPSLKMPTPSMTPPTLGCDAVSPRDYAGRWLVLQVLPRHTKSTAWKLHEDGIGYFLPLYESMYFDGEGKKRFKVLPLFPGYLFVNVTDADQMIRARSIHGVYGSISVPNQFSFAHEMAELHHVAQAFDPNSAIREGSVVRVTTGSLMGYEGPVVQRLKTGKIRVFLRVIGDTYQDIEIEPSRLELAVA
jgi:transcription antitermination factor NusG